MQSALADRNFTSKRIVPFRKADYWYSSTWGISSLWVRDLLHRGDSSLTPLDYAAAFRLPHTFQLARETQAPDEHQFRRAMTILIREHHWDLVHDLWAHGDYDINIFCDIMGNTAVCELVAYSEQWPSQSIEELRRSFLHHPSTSLYCPRHESLIGCAICHLDTPCGCRYHNDPCNRGFENTIAIILERICRDTTSKPGQSARFAVYPPPDSPRSHPPDILNIIAIFLQRADIDLDAHITQMMPPEILLSLLAVSWYNASWYLLHRSFRGLLRPYARRPDIQNIRTQVPEADCQPPILVPTTTAVGITDGAARHNTSEYVEGIPSGEALDDCVIVDTSLIVGGRMTRRVMAVLLVGTILICLWMFSCTCRGHI